MPKILALYHIQSKVGDLAESVIGAKNPIFPAGAMFVHEKFLLETDTVPQVVTVMVKHEKGFSPKTNDGEFFVLNGTGLKLTSRETKGDCSKCHAQAEKTDWVFREYLKN